MHSLTTLRNDAAGLTPRAARVALVLLEPLRLGDGWQAALALSLMQRAMSTADLSVSMVADLRATASTPPAAWPVDLLDDADVASARRWVTDAWLSSEAYRAATMPPTAAGDESA